MRILVFADSHTDIDTMKKVVEKTQPAMIIHLGDHIVDAVMLRAKYPDLLFEMVKGNCDQNNNHPTEKTIKINSLVMFITHGDTYQVNNGIYEIAKAGKSEGANIILHGHTHKPSLSSVQGITIMNPGRIGRISSKKINASYGVIETKASDFCCNIFFYDSFEEGS